MFKAKIGQKSKIDALLGGLKIFFKNQKVAFILRAMKTNFRG